MVLDISAKYCSQLISSVLLYATVLGYNINDQRNQKKPVALATVATVSTYTDLDTGGLLNVQLDHARKKTQSMGYFLQTLLDRGEERRTIATQE